MRLDNENSEGHKNVCMQDTHKYPWIMTFGWHNTMKLAKSNKPGLDYHVLDKPGPGVSIVLTFFSMKSMQSSNLARVDTKEPFWSLETDKEFISLAILSNSVK